MDASTPALSTKIQEDIIKILSVTQVVSQVKKKKKTTKKTPTTKNQQTKPNHPQNKKPHRTLTGSKKQALKI